MTRWSLVTVGFATIVGLLLCPYGTQADRTAPLTIACCSALAVLVALEAKRQALSARLLLVVAALLLTLAVVAPPRTSHDLWSYAMYGRVVTVHHADPYVVPPSRFPADPALRRVDPGWRNAPSVYGPVFTGLSSVVSVVVGDAALPTRLAYQGTAALAVGAVLLALARRGRTAAVAAIGLNPLVVVALVNGGHNDAIVGVLVLASAWAVLRRRSVGAGVVLGVAALIKLTALLPALALTLWTARRHGVRPAALVGAVATAVVAVAYWGIGGVTALRPLAAASGRVSRVSPFGLLPVPDQLGHRELLVLVVVVGVPAVVLTTSRLGASPMAAAAAGVVPYLLAGPYVLPWYFAWAIPVVAFADDQVLVVVVFVETLLVEVAYTYRRVASPDALDQALRFTMRFAQAFECAALGLLVAAAVSIRTHRRRQRSLGPHPRLTGSGAK